MRFSYPLQAASSEQNWLMNNGCSERKKNHHQNKAHLCLFFGVIEVGFH